MPVEQPPGHNLLATVKSLSEEGVFSLPATLQGEVRGPLWATPQPQP